jgi:hypothetical protein
VIKPRTADGYSPDQLEQVRALCLHLASVLGDLLEDLVIVGGLVPSLLIDRRAVGGDAHVGTTDLDLGLELALLNTGRYHALGERLRRNEFEPDHNEQGNLTRQRWRHARSSATVDFLMPPVQQDQRGGTLQGLEADLAAVVQPGLPLAFRDRERIRVEGRTLRNEAIARKLPVCGPGAFVILKALALRGRGENKDAYDLFYVLRYYGSAVEDVAARVKPLLDDDRAREAMTYLREDFASLDSVGSVRTATFLNRSDDDAFKADVAGLVGRLLRGL